MGEQKMLVITFILLFIIGYGVMYLLDSIISLIF